MASKQLVDYFNNAKNIIENQGINAEYVDILIQTAKVAINTEKDIDFGLEITAYAKKCCEDMVATKGYTIWDLEKYCFANGQTYEIIEKYYEILKQESFWNFESFIFYMEKLREPSKRFYLPRRKTLKTVVEDLTQLDSRKRKFYGLSMPSRVGKLISDDTPVLTKNGWKNHGDLIVGDYVVGRSGKWVKVQYVHPKYYANKRVWFSDHTYIDCHENHEWVIYDRSINKEIILETKQLENSLYHEKGKPRFRYFLPVTEPNDCENIELPMNPYVLGAWLGDGTNRKPTLTICHTDKVIIDEILNAGYEKTTCYEQTGCSAYSFNGLRKDLQQFGMCKSRQKTQKYIPDIYFTASKEQRLELLAGLIDTDGTLRKNEHRYDISTSDERLKDDYIKLISTFGWRVCVVEYKPCFSSSGVEGKNINYRIAFNPTCEIPCRVERKQLQNFSKQRRISIERVEDIEPKQGNCITVDGGVYKVGQTMKLTHNSTICIFFLAWVAMKRPNSHSAMGGHSGILAKGFYKELINLMTTEEYTFQELFFLWHPKYANKKFPTYCSAEDFTITLGDPDRFATITCRGIDGTWTGAIDVSWDGYLYVDDLVRDREHSLSPQRMESTFQEYLNKMVDRKSGYDPGDGSFAGASELMVGTLWNVLDPLERMKNLYKDNPLYQFRRIPALSENDKSNFDYDINGFSTEYYLDMRERLDDAEWQAKYQQRPYVREGLLYPTDEINYFNGILPDGDYRIVSACDVALGGGDYLSMPIGAEYSNGDVYVFDWVYNKGKKEVTRPLVAGKIMGNGIREIRFEANQGGDLYCDYIDQYLIEQGYKCSCTHRRAPNKMEKMSKCIAYSGDIKRKFYFLQSKRPTKEELEIDKQNGIKRYVREKEYQDAMDDLHKIVTIGKNEHDDSVDGLTQLAMFIENGMAAKIEVPKNPFRY